MSEGPFSRDAGQLLVIPNIRTNTCITMRDAQTCNIEYTVQVVSNVSVLYVLILNVVLMTVIFISAGELLDSFLLCLLLRVPKGTIVYKQNDPPMEVFKTAQSANENRYSTGFK